MKMLKRQVRHFTGAAAAMSITVVFQASQPVTVRWLRLASANQNARTMISVAGLNETDISIYSSWTGVIYLTC